MIRALTDRHTYHGWLWIEAYQLGPDGDAVERRELFLMPAGVRWLTSPPAIRRPIRRHPARVG
ncbi:hypothetical protein [Micromonospora vulcania]|uniref:Uncharacterized protein n=1 Tax=Micromonospora vulcania TaxID=1441873 RepID=A0ABW1H6M1_9ACTN